MILEDFVMLGKTVPEPSSDGRVFVCSAGYSQELRSLIRIYPLARHAAPRRWEMCRVNLERNPRDSRPESWKLAGDRSIGNHERINSAFTPYAKVNGWERKEVLDDPRLWVDSIAEANEKRLSLALLRPRHIPRVDYDKNHNSPDSPQMRLFDDGLPPAEGAKRFPFMPRLDFVDSSGRHRLMLRDWGCYELMRKHPEHTFDLDDALSLGEDSVLLIGNLNSHRTAWLCISVLNIGDQQLSLLGGVA